MYLGSWKIDDPVTFVVNTHDDTGAAADADSVPTYRVYENETGTPIVTGSMALLDDANTTGCYSEQITLSAASGFEKGKSYNIRITATVGGIAGAIIYTFQIEAEVDANRVNWANVDNPSTTVQLTGTTVKLTADGLDNISTTAPAGVASNFREMMVQVWRRFFKKATKTSTEIKTYADNGTSVLTTQPVTEGSTEEQGAAT